MIRTLLALARAAKDPALLDPSVSNVEDEDLDEDKAVGYFKVGGEKHLQMGNLTE